MLSQLSLPAYILLRIVTIPLSFAFNAAQHSEPRSIFASFSVVLATSSLFLTVLPFTAHIELGNLVLGVSLSIVEALFPIIILRTCRERCEGLTSQGGHEDSSEKQYMATTYNSRLRHGPSSFWPALQLASLLSTVFLVPLLFLSGEMSYIMKDCYVLDITCLWQLFMFTGLLNGALLLVTSLLVMVTSPATTSLMAAPSNAVLLAIFAFGSLTSYSWIGLIGCWLFTLVFAVNQLREGTSPELASTRSAISVLRSVTLILVLCISIPRIGRLSWNHTKPPATEVQSCEFDMTLMPKIVSSKSSKPSSAANDEYLGPRPNADAVVDMFLLLERCSEVADGSGIDDVINCLSFLANEEAKYLILPVAGQGNRASEKSTQVFASGIEESQKDLPSRFIELSSAHSPSTPTMDACPGPVIPFHVYWTGPASWRLELFVKAYLYTQNLPCSRLWLWLDSDIDANAVDKMLCEDPIFQRFRPLISRGDIVLKAWHFPHRIRLPKDATAKINTTSFHPHPVGIGMNSADSIILDGTGKWLILDKILTTFAPVQVSDAIRFIVLHLHGGVYLDMDVLLLRDMRPLLLPNPTTGQAAFAEQWVERCSKSDYNTAVISLPANSSLSTYLLRGGVRMGMNFHPKVIGRMMWRDGRNDELKMLHNAVFDPLVTNLRRKGTDNCTVPCHKNFESVFMRNVDEAENEWVAYEGEPGMLTEGTWPPTNRSLEHFFRGAWAYHIHNQVLFLPLFQLCGWVLGCVEVADSVIYLVVEISRTDQLDGCDHSGSRRVF